MTSSKTSIVPFTFFCLLVAFIGGPNLVESDQRAINITPNKGSGINEWFPLSKDSDEKDDDSTDDNEIVHHSTLNSFSDSSHHHNSKRPSDKKYYNSYSVFYPYEDYTSDRLPVHNPKTKFNNKLFKKEKGPKNSLNNHPNSYRFPSIHNYPNLVEDHKKNSGNDYYGSNQNYFSPIYHYPALHDDNSKPSNGKTSYSDADSSENEYLNTDEYLKDSDKSKEDSRTDKISSEPEKLVTQPSLICISKPCYKQNSNSLQESRRHDKNYNGHLGIYRYPNSNSITGNNHHGKFNNPLGANHNIYRLIHVPQPNSFRNPVKYSQYGHLVPQIKRNPFTKAVDEDESERSLPF